MDHFHHHDGRLRCEEVALGEIAAAVGTPVYVYSARTVRDHARRLQEAFAPLGPLICYAVKANGALALLERVAAEGLGFEVVSGGELRRALAAGGEPGRIVFSGVGKTAEEMAEALRAGVLLLTVESEEELEVLAAVAAREGRRAGVAIRLNPDVDPRTHRHVATGRGETKFGLDGPRALALAERALAHPALALRGVQCHIGSQVTRVEPYAQAVRRTLALADALRSRAPELAWLDMGGGFGIVYDDAHVPALADYARALAPLLAGRALRLILEPGRVIVGNAGVLLTRVLYRKASGARRFLVVDAGMNDLLRPSLYGGHHRIWPVEGEAPPGPGGGAAHPCWDVVGPVCEAGDFLGLDRALPPVAPGAVLAVMSAGAYGYAMASNYNGRRRPAEVLVDGARWAVVRRRETWDDLERLDVRAPAWRAAGREAP